MALRVRIQHSTLHLARVGTREGDYSTGTRYRGTSLMRNHIPPRTAIGPYAYAYCRVWGGGGFL